MGLKRRSHAISIWDCEHSCYGFARVHVDHGNCSAKSNGLDPIDEEFEALPYTNNGFISDPDWKLEPGRCAMVVYIQGFFSNGRDFAYYVIGEPNVTAFLGGIFGMQAYNGPLLATPIMFNGYYIAQNHDRVLWSNSHMERVKWKYLFETARLAWHKLLIDPRKVKYLRAVNARDLRDESAPVADPSAD
jgi:hypothetical protein